MTYYNDIQWHSNCLNSNILTTSDDILWHRSRSWRIPDHKECKSIPKVANMVYRCLQWYTNMVYFGFLWWDIRLSENQWDSTGIPLGPMPDSAKGTSMAGASWTNFSIHTLGYREHVPHGEIQWNMSTWDVTMDVDIMQTDTTASVMTWGKRRSWIFFFT